MVASRRMTDQQRYHHSTHTHTQTARRTWLPRADARQDFTTTPKRREVKNFNCRSSEEKKALSLNYFSNTIGRMQPLRAVTKLWVWLAVAGRNGSRAMRANTAKPNLSAFCSVPEKEFHF